MSWVKFAFSAPFVGLGLWAIKGKSANLDELDCTDPACMSREAMFRKMLGRANMPEKLPPKPSWCPLDRDELGRMSWAVLHTIAAYYPDEPSEEEREHAKNFMIGFAHLYPCLHCKEDFVESIKTRPPEVDSRKDFSLWLCELHNDVNEKLGMKRFSCSLESLDTRWRTGASSCWELPKGGVRSTAEKTMGR